MAARTDASSPSKRYAVAFADATSVPANAAAIVAKAGGRIVSRLGPIGGVIAVSSNAGFRSERSAPASCPFGQTGNWT